MLPFSIMNRMFAAVLAGLVLAAALPGGAGETTPPAPLINVYFAEGALGLEAPSGTESKRHEVVGLFAGPTHTDGLDPWGGITFADGFTFATDTVATFWIDPEEASIITSMRVELTSGETEIARGTTGQIAGTSGENLLDGTRKVQISIPTQGLEAGADLQMRILYWGAALAGTPTTVHVLYDSETHPSRLSFGVDATNTHIPVTGNARTYYLDDESLTPIAPTGEESKRRAHGELGLANLATSAAFVWGTFTTEQDLDLVGDTTLTFWVAHSGDPGLMRSIRPTVTIGGTEYTTSGGVDAWTFTDGEIYGFSIGFNTAGVHVPAGTEVTLDFRMWSTNSAELGEIEYLYGSTEHPARLTLRAAGAPELLPGVAPSISLTLDTNELELTPGETKQAALTLTADGNATVELNATTSGDATIGFPEGGTFTLGAVESRDVPITVRAGPDAIMNTSFNVTIEALVDGVVSAATELTVHVISPDAEETEPPTPPTATGTEPNGTAGTATEPDEAETIPAPGLVLVAVIGVAVALFARRRR